MWLATPSFSKKATALDDFMKPDRVVVGVSRAEVAQVMRELYAPFLRTEKPFLVMTPESAEMTKYVANAMLATKISFINEMANLCETLRADINEVRRGIGHDQRIGFQFLFPGPGWGGSCFPKDIQALLALARKAETPLALLESVHQVNEAQKRVLPDKIRRHFGTALKGKTLAVWGLSFKPRTDDIREGACPNLDQRDVERRNATASSRPGGNEERLASIWRPSGVWQQSVSSFRRSRWSGDYDRMAGISPAGFYPHAQSAQNTAHFRWS